MCSTFNCDGPVGVADKVGEHVDVHVDALGAEGGHDGDDVVRGPARDEGPQDEGDGLQSLLGPVFRLDLFLLLPPELDPLADLFHDVLFIPT